MLATAEHAALWVPMFEEFLHRPDEGVHELAEHAAGDRLHRTVLDRPAVFGQVPGSAQHIEQWRVCRVVLVDGLGVRRVVPVMELRRDDYVPQPADIHLEV